MMTIVFPGSPLMIEEEAVESIRTNQLEAQPAASSQPSDPLSSSAAIGLDGGGRRKHSGATVLMVPRGVLNRGIRTVLVTVSADQLEARIWYPHEAW